MKLFTVLFVLLVGLLLVQLGDSCSSMTSMPVPRRPQPTCNHTNTNSKESESLEITPPQQGDSVLWSIVEDGARRGFDECQKVFNSNRWNCPLVMYKKLPLFDNTTFPYATRETAVIHAISAAAIMHEITHQCRHNKTPGCDCPPKRKTKFERHYVTTWGCSDNIEFGEKEARRLTDRLEKGHDALVAVNLHNNEVGREVVRTSVRTDCICYGINHTCSFKHCWKELAPFEVVASTLKKKYHEAVQVRLVHKELRDPFGRAVSSSDQTLVYLDNSPHPCERNDTLGYPGMLGRSCRSNEAKDKCELFSLLCSQGCNLRVEKVERYKPVPCNCKFVWCCNVKCEECMEKYSEITCNALKEVETDIEARAYP